ncbi:MAG TPA: hypothetical protein PKE16_02070 [Hyphomicrobium sp.]|nr:hypothetical protein [Hyphomicrobium sp.]
MLQPERFEKYLDGMAKTIKAFGGTVMPSDYFMATKYGRASAMNWNDDFTNSILPSIIQELGASSTGTALMSMYQAIVAGTMSGKAISAWDKIGMIDHSKFNTSDLTPEGRVKRVEPGAFVGAQDFMSNPFAWMWGDNGVVAHLVEHGKLTQNQVDLIKSGDLKEGEGAQARKDLTEYLGLMFGNRTAQGMSDVLIMQYKKIMREANLRNQAMGLDEGAKFYGGHDLNIAKEAFHQQLEAFETALGAPEVNNATRNLHLLTDAITALTQAMVKHPILASAGMEALLGGGLVLIAGGLAVLTIAVVGPAVAVAAALSTLAVGIGSLFANDWHGIATKSKQMFQDAHDWLFGSDEYMDENGGHHARVKSVFQRLGQAISEGVQRWYGDAVAGINAVIAKIGAAIQSAFASLSGITAGGGHVDPGPGQGPRFRGFGVQKQSYTPPSSGGQPAVIHINNVIDGRKVGESVVHHMIRASSHVQSAANFDGVASPTPVDFSYT